MFVIERGRVRLTLGSGSHEKVISVFGEGEFFGELSLLSGAPRTATAVAVDESVLFAINRDVFRMMVQDDLDVVFRMLNAQGQRLSLTNQPIEVLMKTLLRLRILAHVARTVVAEGGPPCTLEIAQLANDLGVDVERVREVLMLAADQGAGMVRDHAWELPSSEQLQVLLDLVCREAQPPSD